MRRLIAVALLGALTSVPLSAALSTSEQKRIEDAARVLRELHSAPDQDVPLDLWEKASCVMVIPGLKKAAFIIGGEYGKGLLSCRTNASGNIVFASSRVISTSGKYGLSAPPWMFRGHIGHAAGGELDPGIDPSAPDPEIR